MRIRILLLALLVPITTLGNEELVPCGESESDGKNSGEAIHWRKKAVDYARIMSRVKWTPVAEGMPKRGGHFEAGKEYTGVPYSSVKAEGRYVGFDIF